MSLQNFKIIKRLGEGAYSSVYSVQRHDDGQAYALKKVKMGKLSDKEKENALNEVRILASIAHTNICAYHEAFMDESTSSLCIIMEYANNGDLFQKITRHQKEQTYLREDDIWRIFIQVVKGLKALHDTDIFHRDLKSANVFLNKDGTAKLGDMNVSKVAKRGLLYTQTGTPYYASPEVWRDQPYDMKSDIWSLGCVLYESITLRPPFRADDMAGLYRKVLRGAYSRIPDHFSADLAEVTKQLVQVQAQLRPSCDDILRMPAVVRMGERLFMDDFYDDMDDSPMRNELLSTIRVPKNLLYLTDRLPKPVYDMDRVRNRSTEEETKQRKTHDVGDQQRLPTIPRQSKNAKQAAANKQQQQAPLTDRPGGNEEVTQSQALPNLEKQRLQHQKAVNSKQKNLKKQSPPPNQQQNGKARSLERNSDTEPAQSIVNAPINNQATLAESASQRSIKQAEIKTRESGRAANQKSNPQKAQQILSNQQHAKDFENQPLIIQGENTTKQAARRVAQSKVQTRANTQILQQSVTPKNKSSALSNVRRDSVESANEYEAEEFEKDDLVQMAEPHKPIMRQQKGRNPEHKIGEKATNDTATTRAGEHSDNNSLMREISIRNSKQPGGENHSGGGNVPQLKQINRGKGLNRDASKDILNVVSARDAVSPSKESLGSIVSNQHMQSHRQVNPVYKSHGQHPMQVAGMYERGHQNQGGHHLQRKPRVNYPGNMAYINISSDGQRLVGPLGLKKAEQELIKRRYKYSYNNQDSISRVALVYGQHGQHSNGGGSVGNRNGGDTHTNDGQVQYQYQSNNRLSGSGSGRDIQSIYRRQKVHNSGDNALPKLPRISNQRDVSNQIINKGLPPIQGSHAVMGSQLTGRNVQNQALYQNGPSYRNMKNRQRGIGQTVLTHGEHHGYSSGQGPYSLDRQQDNMQASLNAMQIQQQPMRERPQAVSMQKKAILQKRLDPIQISSVGSPMGSGADGKRIISPNNHMPKTTTGKVPAQLISSDQQ